MPKNSALFPPAPASFSLIRDLKSFLPTFGFSASPDLLLLYFLLRPPRLRPCYPPLGRAPCFSDIEVLTVGPHSSPSLSTSSRSSSTRWSLLSNSPLQPSISASSFSISFSTPQRLKAAVRSRHTFSSSSLPHLSFSLPNSSSSGMVQKGKEGGEMVADAEIERLPVDLLAHIFSLLSSFWDLAQASGVCRKWRRGVEQSLASRERLSFAGWKMDDASTARLVCAAYNLKELDMYASLRCRESAMPSLPTCLRSLASVSLLLKLKLDLLNRINGHK